MRCYPQENQLSASPWQGPFWWSRVHTETWQFSFCNPLPTSTLIFRLITFFKHHQHFAHCYTLFQEVKGYSVCLSCTGTGNLSSTALTPLSFIWANTVFLQRRQSSTSSLEASTFLRDLGFSLQALTGHLVPFLGLRKSAGDGAWYSSPHIWHLSGCPAVLILWPVPWSAPVRLLPGTGSRPLKMWTSGLTSQGESFPI